MNRLATIKVFLDFLREREKGWIAPVAAFLFASGALLIFAKGAARTPFLCSLSLGGTGGTIEQTLAHPQSSAV